MIKTLNKYLIQTAIICLLAHVNSYSSIVEIEFVNRNNIPLESLSSFSFVLDANFDSPELSFSRGDISIQTPEDQSVIINQIYVSTTTPVITVREEFLCGGYIRESMMMIPQKIMPYYIQNIIKTNVTTNNPLLNESVRMAGIVDTKKNANKITITAIDENTLQVTTTVGILNIIKEHLEVRVARPLGAPQLNKHKGK